MYVLVVGLRGFPGIQGGIETHCEQLYPRLVELGADVEVVTRSSYWSDTKPTEYLGVKLTSVWSPSSMTLETFVHSFLAVLYGIYKRPDVIHLHAIGPAFFSPLARLAGLKVVVTHHGPDYDREKWGFAAKTLLRLGERLGMRFANRRIVISETIRDLIAAKYSRSSDLIANGVPKAQPVTASDWLTAQGVTPGRYVLQVSRLVPEKRQLDLIQAFETSAIQDQGWHLLLVGALDSDDDYQNSLRDVARRNPNVVLTGFQSGASLREILSHAGVFVLPSSHEGLPIALLEALSYSLRCLASDIPANLEVPMAAEQFFGLGDVEALTTLLTHAANQDWTDEDRARALAIADAYDWDEIAARTLEVYQ